MISSDIPQHEIQPAMSYEEYGQLAKTEVDAELHAKGRRVFSKLMYVRMGDFILDLSPGFVEHADEIEQGGNIVASVHRDELETLDLPCALEQAGIHHMRPIGKSSIVEMRIPVIGKAVKNTVIRWGMVPVARGCKDLSGLNHFQDMLLDPERENGPGNLGIYDEKTRVRVNVKKVKSGGSAVVLAAGLHDSLITPWGIAGFSTEINPDTKKKISRDKRSIVGRSGILRVHAAGDPFRLGALPGVREYQRGELKGVDLELFQQEKERRNEIVHDAMQKALNRAYEVRGSSLEKKYRRFGILSPIDN